MNSFNDYLNLWFSKLTSFAVEESLNNAIFSTITENLNHHYLIKLNKELTRSSYQSIPEITLLQNNSEIQTAAYSYKNETIFINEDWLKEILELSKQYCDLF